MQKLWATLFILAISITASAQGEYNNWHFGQNTSIRFNGGPSPTTGSQITSGKGCAAISDSLGNLLFYTNGETVWSADHAVMPNGTGLFGSPDVQQTVLIVPRPFTPGIYYIFTIGPAGALTKALNYSIVDMTLNGSLGDISQKNTLLDDNVSEKLTATKNKNDSAYWVVEKSAVSNQFRSFEVTENGIDAIAVISAAGLPIQNGDLSGAIKISNNGCWLIATTRGLNGNSGTVELCRFDNKGGKVYDGASTTAIPHPYGLEFSSDNNKFYVGESVAAPMHQFNLNTQNINAGINSLVNVSDTLPATFAMQSAPDGKIYFVTDSASLFGSIQSPNSYFTGCNVVLSPSDITGLDLPNTFSLPNNFNLTYKGLLSCGEAVAGCKIDLDKLMPKAFTPNGDGLNDCYGIKFKDSLPFLDFGIYNRWGQRVFYTTSENDCWDGNLKGKRADIGNYVYYLRLRVDCGYAIKTGYFVLIR